MKGKPIKIRAFTLLELMVCLVLISLLGALVGVKGIDLLAHHRFRSSLQTWLLDIERAQILAMHQKCDVICTIKKRQEGGYLVTLKSDSPIFSPSSYTWKDVEKIFFQESLIETFSVTFSSTGRIFPQGILQIAPYKKEKDALFLDLSYPVVFHTNSLRFLPFPPPFVPLKEKKLSESVDK